MKLSFSTKGWQKYGLKTLVDIAYDLHFTGIEIYDIHDDDFINGVFDELNISATRRELNDKNIRIPCVDALCDIAENTDESYNEIIKCIDFAADVRSKNVRVHAYDNDKTREENSENIIALLGRVLPYAIEKDVSILVESVGLFTDTAYLREILNSFANDNLAALWDFHHPYFFNNETPAKTIENLGAYVRHVHIKDSKDGEYCLIGNGDLPVLDFMNALKSINYDGFISLEWTPEWLQDIDDPEIIFAHFYNFMLRFELPSRRKSSLYSSKRGDGQYPWKKDILISKTFPQVLDRMVEEFPDQYAFKYTTLDYTRTYAQFRDDVDDFARALISLGVKEGSHVAVWATNLPEWFISFWATTKIGAVLVTMNTAYKIHEAEYLLKQSDAHTLIMIENCRDSDYSGIISEICPELEHTKPGEQLHSKRLPFLRNVITVGFKKKGCLTFEEALKRHNLVPLSEVQRRADNIDPNDVANMQYTSGTTGFPKGVMLTHYNIVNNGKCIGDRMDLSTADRLLIHVPMFHCFGMVLAMTAAMTHGTTILPLPYFSAKSALACINQEKITACHGVPTMFIAMLENPNFDKTDFSYMRTGIMAGSPCPIEIMQRVVDKMNMSEITIVYGQTESSPGCTMSSAEDSLEVRVSTVGRALPEIECKIVDPETGEDLPDNVTGEFVARGYNIMKGYYKMPEATAAAIDADGWLHTGDLACRTPEGNYRITGRLKDMIIRGGENLYPKEIEDFLYTCPAVKDVQVIGVPDEQYGEEAMAWIVLKDGDTSTEDDIRTYCMERIARHKVPRYFHFVKSFPMNAAGKILKYKMREDAIEILGLQKAASTETA
ncbi:MAG TPA: AMP-binding protein [Clostridiales bacterium]|nr:AMP-binding protein [Clostridiales bacterium]